jgi:hypothetical protein
MKSNSARLLSFILLIFSFQILSAQTKFEYEESVPVENVPENAIIALDELFSEVKSEKWYKEISDEGVSFEAKFKSLKNAYSMEFDSSGVFQDIEQLIDFSTIPINTHDTILIYLETNFDGFKITRTQRQYSGSFEEVMRLFSFQSNNAILQYEIEFNGKKNKEKKRWEALFDAEGNLVRIREVKSDSSINLIY